MSSLLWFSQAFHGKRTAMSQTLFGYVFLLFSIFTLRVLYIFGRFSYRVHSWKRQIELRVFLLNRDMHSEQMPSLPPVSWSALKSVTTRHTTKVPKIFLFSSKQLMPFFCRGIGRCGWRAVQGSVHRLHPYHHLFGSWIRDGIDENSRISAESTGRLGETNRTS